MKITDDKILIRDLVEGFVDGGDDGVVGYGGRLNIRPAFQREFIYPENDQKLVIDSILNEFPLNSIYLAVKDDDTFDLLDGQQRVLSICYYVDGRYKVDDGTGHEKYFHSLFEEDKEKILNYPLEVYKCAGGSYKEKMGWFERINIVGKALNSQEVRNAVYYGEWVADAKRYFSSPNCGAESIGKKFIKATTNRQEYLEIAIDWISNGDIDGYMQEHRHDEDAKELWDHFEKVIDWIDEIFVGKDKGKNTRGEMKSVSRRWGDLYREHGDKELSPADIQSEVSKLMLNGEIGKRAGIYEYVLTGDERTLMVRTFSKDMKGLVFEEQNGICPSCKNRFKMEEMEADHITPWSEGGKTEKRNCQMLCKKCNRKKSNK